MVFFFLGISVWSLWEPICRYAEIRAGYSKSNANNNNTLPVSYVIIIFSTIHLIVFFSAFVLMLTKWKMDAFYRQSTSTPYCHFSDLGAILPCRADPASLAARTVASPIFTIPFFHLAKMGCCGQRDGEDAAKRLSWGIQTEVCSHPLRPQWCRMRPISWSVLPDRQLALPSRAEMHIQSACAFFGCPGFIFCRKSQRKLLFGVQRTRHSSSSTCLVFQHLLSVFWKPPRSRECWLCAHTIAIHHATHLTQNAVSRALFFHFHLQHTESIFRWSYKR